MLQRQTPGAVEPFRGDRPPDRLALADHADAVPARRDDRRAQRSAISSRRLCTRRGLQRSEIDSGAVILTGEAIKRTNARAIDELFADEAGKFVCATAGHKLECRLAAHGSGAVALSKERGHLRAACRYRRRHDQARADRSRRRCCSVCGLCRRRPADRAGRRRAPGRASTNSARLAADDLGLPPDAATRWRTPTTRKLLAVRLADVAADYIARCAARRAWATALALTEPLPRSRAP